MQVVALDWVETLDASKLHMDQDEFLARMLEAGIDDAAVFAAKSTDPKGRQQRPCQRRQHREWAVRRGFGA